MGGFWKRSNFPSVSRQHPIPRKINLRNNCSFPSQHKSKKQDYDSFQRVPEPGEGRWKQLHFFPCRTCSDFLFIALDSYKEKCGLIENEIMRIRIIEGESLSVSLDLEWNDGKLLFRFFDFSIEFWLFYIDLSIESYRNHESN
jgi:hypothetical protein